jgi:4-methyl-5(b-hydroxyethyl)-thiazole monophosphate biosynthesis
MARVLVPLAPGFEEIEAVAIIDVLRRAGVRVDVAGTVPGAVVGSHGIRVATDLPIEAARAADYDAIALPGGMPGTRHLREHPAVLRLVGELAERGRYTTAICAAPTVLVAAGVARGRTLTSHPSVRREVEGVATYSEARVVCDGTVVTSRGPGTAVEFALALVTELVGEDTARTLRAAMLAA